MAGSILTCMGSWPTSFLQTSTCQVCFNVCQDSRSWDLLLTHIPFVCVSVWVWCMHTTGQKRVSSILYRSLVIPLRQGVALNLKVASWLDQNPASPVLRLCLCQSWSYRYFLTCCIDAVIQILSLMITEQTFLTPEPSLSPLFFSLSLRLLVLCMFVYLDLSSIL